MASWFFFFARPEESDFHYVSSQVGVGNNLFL